MSIALHQERKNIGPREWNAEIRYNEVHLHRLMRKVHYHRAVIYENGCSDSYIHVPMLKKNIYIYIYICIHTNILY
jgi:hypothetical protein